MANYNSSYTGAQIDVAVAKASAIPDPTGHLNTVLTHKTTGESWEKVGAAQMTAGTATNGQILIAGDDATVAWGNVPAPAGTSVTSTGATSGQVLTADGNGGASWQAGGGVLYETSLFGKGTLNGEQFGFICNIFGPTKLSTTTLTNYTDIFSLLAPSIGIKQYMCIGGINISSNNTPIVELGVNANGFNLTYADKTNASGLNKYVLGSSVFSSITLSFSSTITD